VGNDLYHDISGAQQVGMKAILVSFDQGPIVNQSITPDYTVFRFADLPQAINHFAKE